MSTPPPVEDDKTAGILLAATSFALYSVMDVAVKLLSARYAVPQIIFFNSLISLVPILAYAAWKGGLRRQLGTRRPGVHLIRALCSVISSFCGFYAYSRMPIANVYTLAFAAPLFITALSVPMLGETVGWRRWSAVLVGFAGVLIVLRPGAGMVDVAALAVLCGSFFYSVGSLLTRRARDTESPVAFAFYSCLAAILVTGTMLPAVGRMPTLPDLGLWTVGGLVCGTAMVGLLTAYRLAPAAVVAPFQYTQLIWGVLAGYILFGTQPDARLFVGGGIVMASGLYILHRETRVRGRAEAEPILLSPR